MTFVMQDVGVERVYIKYDCHLFIRYVHYLLQHYLSLQFSMDVPSVPGIRPSGLNYWGREVIHKQFFSLALKGWTLSRLPQGYAWICFSTIWPVSKSMRCHVYSATLV